MKRITSLMVTLALAGCGGGAPVDFKQGFPTQQMVTADGPDKASTGGKAGTGQSQQGLQGEASGAVGLTRLAAGVVNGTTVWILGALKAVTDTPATSLKGNVAVWGPFTPELSATTWKLTVTRSGNRNFNYVLEAKLKSQDDSQYQAVLSGTHVAAVNAAGAGVPGYGSGNFLIDWKVAASVGGDQTRKSGNAEVTYSHLSATDASTVDVTFNELQAGDTVPRKVASYHYKSAASTGGELEFGTDLNAHWWDPAHPVLAHWSIKSRWQVNGAGRADSRLTGGDLTAPATQTECWDQNFLSAYIVNSADKSSSANWGTASACAFTSADYASP